MTALLNNTVAFAGDLDPIQEKVAAGELIVQAKNTGTTDSTEPQRATPTSMK